MNWTDIWKRPFKKDDYGYIWADDNVMTFSVDDLTEENDKWMQEFCGNIVAALNGEECKKYEDIHIKDGCDIYQGETLIGSFRGWGFLRGAMKLTPEQAASIQDEMIEYVMGKISK